MAVGLAVRIAYVYALRHKALVGDEIEYDIEGRFFAHGHPFWSTTPYGIPHASIWKTPGYQVWVGVLYALLGDHHVRVEMVQTLLGPVTIVLTWLLGRRLFGYRAGLAAAAIVAIYPFAFQYEGLLYTESLATPLTTLVLLLSLERRPSVRRAVVVGAIIGVSLLIRPSGLFLFPLVAAAWVAGRGWRRGALLTVATVAVAAVVVIPWTVRNHHVSGAWVPLSMQDAGAYGTFNDEAAHDSTFPWAWRAITRRSAPLFDRRHPLPDAVLRSKLIKLARDYASDHPSSVIKAFYWNGLIRLWDIRSPHSALHEVKFSGRSRALTWIGLFMYWILLALAVIGLWRERRRLGLVPPLLLAAIAASVIFTTDAATRYRAPLEPMIVVLAMGTLLGAGTPLLRRRPGSRGNSPAAV